MTHFGYYDLILCLQRLVARVTQIIIQFDCQIFIMSHMLMVMHTIHIAIIKEHDAQTWRVYGAPIIRVTMQSAYYIDFTTFYHHIRVSNI